MKMAEEEEEWEGRGRFLLTNIKTCYKAVVNKTA